MLIIFMDRPKFDKIETVLTYLTDLVSFAEREVNNCLFDGIYDFSKTKELGRILEEYQLRDDNTSPSGSFPYFSFWRVVRKDSNKIIRNIPELALEMRLLRYEIDNAQDSSTERLELLRSVLYDLYIEFLSETKIRCTA